jgi:hypothetical protein
MTSLNSLLDDEVGEHRNAALAPHQIRAASAPHLPLSQLANSQVPMTAGNFNDLDSLLENLGSPPVFELGKPLPSERYLPKIRAGSCPESHNRALLDDSAD